MYAARPACSGVLNIALRVIIYGRLKRIDLAPLNFADVIWKHGSAWVPAAAGSWHVACTCNAIYTRGCACRYRCGSAICTYCVHAAPHAKFIRESHTCSRRSCVSWCIWNHANRVNMRGQSCVIIMIHATCMCI